MNIKKIIINILCILLIAAYIISICPREMQNDTFWSICIGQELVEKGIKDVDEWSIHDNLKYVAHHFLTDVMIYFGYELGGFAGLYIMEIILTAVITILFYVSNKNITGNSKLSYVFLYVELLLCRSFISVRAQMISAIIFLLQFIMLEKLYKTNNKRYAIVLAFLPLLLANFHMGVIPLYFIIIGVYIFSSFDIGNKEIIAVKNLYLLKTLILVSIIGIGLIFVNPYGIDGVLYGIKTLLSDSIPANIQEFRPLTINKEIGIIIFVYMFVIITAVFINRKIYLKDLLLIIGTLFMSCVSIRYILYFAIFSSVMLYYLKNIKLNLKQNDIIALNTTITFVLISLILIFCGVRIEDKHFINENVYPVMAYQNTYQYFTGDTRLFNEYQWGSYFMLNGKKVFIDSRVDLYTEEYNKGITVFKDYLEIELRYKEIIDKYDINMFFVKSNTPLTTIISLDEDFKQVYKDDIAEVYIKE